LTLEGSELESKCLASWSRSRTKIDRLCSTSQISIATLKFKVLHAQIIVGDILKTRHRLSGLKTYGQFLNEMICHFTSLI
jgi:hypothetical protein